MSAKLQKVTKEKEVLDEVGSDEKLPFSKLQTQSSDLGRQRDLSEYHTKLEDFLELESTQEESYSA